MSIRPLVCAVAFGLIALAGCGPAKLNVDHTFELEPGDAKALDLSAQPKEQQLTINFTSTDGEVTVYLFKADDAKGDEGLTSADAKKALATKKGKDGGFVVTVPANTATRLIVRDVGKKTKVEVKVTNKK